MEVDSDNMSEEYTQKKPKARNSRPARRKVSMATRRRSRLLYLEKYGLNQPDWHTSQDDYGEEANMEDSNNNERRTEYTAEPEEISPPVEPIIKRPVSIRNFVQSTTSQKRPKRFVKPQKSNSDYMSFPATEFKLVHKLMDDYTDKIYMEGYLYKRNDFNSNGSVCGVKKWSPWYVELCGPVLTLWDNSSTTAKEIYPQYINITDSTVQIEDRLTAETRTNLFSLNSAGANRFMLQAADPISLSKWILAIRLSCFECARIQEMYTRAFISRPQFKPLLSIKDTKFEGFLQVRFPGSTGWKKFWACVSSTRVEKKLFTKKLVPTGGQIMFYESRKAKYPVMILQNVVQVYTVYPESPKLINLATLFKIEGSLFKIKSNNEQLVSASSSALLMTSNTNELVQWLIGCFNAFKLYGRPDYLLDDPRSQRALNFAEENANGNRLFLEPDQVDHVNIRSNLLENKKEFSSILDEIVAKGPATPQPSPPEQEERRLSTTSNNALETDRSSNVTTTTTRTSQLKNSSSHPTHLRTVTCASDVSDDEDIEHMDDSESDSDESLFKTGTAPVMNKSKSTPGNLSSFVKPITPNTSKSSSEISDVAPSKPIAADMFLPPVSATLDQNFSTDVLSEIGSQKYRKGPSNSISDSEDFTAPQQSKAKKSKKSNKPFYAVQGTRSNSMVMSPQWPMYSSTASIVTGDHYNRNSHNWETSSVDPGMLMGNSNNSNSYFSSHDSLHHSQSQYGGNNRGYTNDYMDEDDDDDDAPIASAKDRTFSRNSLLDRVGQDRTTAKSIEKNVRATGNPLVNMPSRQSAPRSGLLGVIQEKELENKSQDYQSMMNEQLLAQERMLMEQRQQQLMMFQVIITLAPYILYLNTYFDLLL